MGDINRRYDSTVIVFSKDRPMQLHAYLESLFRFSDCRDEMVYVLYKEVLPISYHEVKEYYPLVNWIKEEDFRSQLEDILEKAGQYVMFGCDDVVFTGYFHLSDMEEYLNRNEEVFGCSLRLGRNIRPFPRHVTSEGMFCRWDWTEEKSHYGYPWELDCTLYRKADVKRIITQAGRIESPNFLEYIPEQDPQKYIGRKYLACYSGRSKALVITVNRVQDTHPNEVDDSGRTDVLSLFIQYRYEKKRLDIDAICTLRNVCVHVGNEYFILTGKQYYHKTGGALQNFMNNIRFLWKNLLPEWMELEKTENMLYIQLQNMSMGRQTPLLLNSEDTVRLLQESPKSFCRFGDGEFTLMGGNSIAFQDYDPELALALWEIFATINTDVYIGIPYQQFEAPVELNDWVRRFYFSSGQKVRDFLYKYMSRERRLYIDTGFNQVYQTYRDMNFAVYYEQVKKLFQGKRLTIIVGEGVLDSLKYNVFEYAADIDYLYGPRKNAYVQYEDILHQALKLTHDRLICVILGPAGKVLVRDLTGAGYMAWDIGHLAKDYDAFRKRSPRGEAEITRIFEPD